MVSSGFNFAFKACSICTAFLEFGLSSCAYKVFNTGKQNAVINIPGM
jgi:hypothetical protein